MTEIMPAMRARHKAEVRAAIVAQARRRISQTEAAKALDMKLTGLNNLICRLNIDWPVKMQGSYKQKLEQEK